MGLLNSVGGELIKEEKQTLGYLFDSLDYLTLLLGGFQGPAHCQSDSSQSSDIVISGIGKACDCSDKNVLQS
jgi:hypothetical protein